MYKRKCKVIFICHGATIYSQDNRLFDNPNFPPLNTEGKEEIEKLSKWMLGRNPQIDNIYSSSALKSIQSTKIIAEKYGAFFDIVEGLNSKKSGIWNGLNFNQIEELFPEMLDEYHNDKANFKPSGGESLVEFNKRINEIIDFIVAENRDKRVILVAQADVIQSVIAKNLDISPENQGKIYIPTGSATQISYYEGWASLVYSGYIPT